jgi:type II secretory pathway pseudopilin PulG
LPGRRRTAPSNSSDDSRTRLGRRATAAESCSLNVSVAVMARIEVLGGYSLIELTFVVGLVATLSAITAPPILTNLDDFRTAGAAWHMSARLQAVRMEAVVRSADVALRFTATPGGYTYAVFQDGNGNGVRTRDIQQGTDRQIQMPERLPDQFAGVDFGTLPGLPPIDPGGSPPGDDPIRLGSSDILTFSALGTSSSGSLYIRGQRTAQYAIRVLGLSGKTRLLKFDSRARQWKPL